MWDTGLTAVDVWTVADDQSTWRGYDPQPVTRSSE